MFKHTAFLTLATILGLALGFCREWLIISRWGVTGATDALLVALFFTEALRSMLGSGLVSAAALPMWAQQTESHRKEWFSQIALFWCVAGLSIGVICFFFSGAIASLIGIGLKNEHSQLAGHLLSLIAVSIPCIFAQSILAVPHQSADKYMAAGLSSFLFNLPSVAYLALTKTPSMESLIWCFNLGAFCMVIVLLPYCMQTKCLKATKIRWSTVSVFIHQLWPLLISGLASQGLMLLERICGSLLGDGVITLVNFARKLINLPLIVLMSLNQILLSKMSQSIEEQREKLLSIGLNICTALTLPAAFLFASAAHAIIYFAMPNQNNSQTLALLLAAFSPSIIFGSWNALMARYFYAKGQTKLPLMYELIGNLAQAGAMLSLPFFIGITGFPWAVMVGVMTTATLLCIKINASLLASLVKMTVGSAIVLLVGYFGFTSPLLANMQPIMQLACASAIASLLLVFSCKRYQLFSRGRA